MHTIANHSPLHEIAAVDANHVDAFIGCRTPELPEAVKVGTLERVVHRFYPMRVVR